MMNKRDFTNEQYKEYIKHKGEPTPLWRNMLFAFVIGGAICALGQALCKVYTNWGATLENAKTWTSVSLIFLGILLTALGVYDNIAHYGGAGTLVPITGFANAMASPAIEFKSEGLVLGVGKNVFAVVGGVILYGVTASVVYGLIYWLTKVLA